MGAGGGRCVGAPVGGVLGGRVGWGCRPTGETGVTGLLLGGQFGCVVEGGFYGVGGYGGIALGDLVYRQAGREVVEDDGDHDAGAGDAGLTVADVGIDGDVVVPGHGRPVGD